MLTVAEISLIQDEKDEAKDENRFSSVPMS